MAKRRAAPALAQKATGDSQRGRRPSAFNQRSTLLWSKSFGELLVVTRSPFEALPNESRLSCGATLKYSQMEFYHTARRTFAGLIEEGRRQLQAHVRLRTTSHSSGPFLFLSRRSTHRPCPGT